jgi:putative Holliday junction resolvase
MKYLGIDYGSKRVGVSVSDETGSFAFPVVVIENSENLVEEIFDICRQKKIDQIVVGESKNFEMKENEIMREISPFVEKLKEKTKLPVVMHPEFLSSMEAKQLQGESNMLDASAAAIILKSYLDTKNNSL